MAWNWQRPERPDFAWDQAALNAFERQFLLESGELVGAFRHIEPDDQNALRIDLISDEAVKTSEIEGEILNQDSVQSSLRHQFGLDPLNVKVPSCQARDRDDDGRPLSWICVTSSRAVAEVYDRQIAIISITRRN